MFLWQLIKITLQYVSWGNTVVTNMGFKPIIPKLPGRINHRHHKPSLLLKVMSIYYHKHLIKLNIHVYTALNQCSIF